MAGQSRSCWICGDALARSNTDALSLCSKPACRFAYNSHPRSRLCSQCSRPLTLDQSTAGVCADPTCRTAATAARHARLEEQNRVQAREISKLVHLRAGPAAADIPVTFLPSNSRRLTRLPEQRAQTFLQNLEKLLAQIESEGWIEDREPAPEMPPVPTDPDVLAVATQGCIGCKGYCCQMGREHAFVTLRTLRRIRASQPNVTVGDLREMYRSRLTGETYEDACVFQGAQGCKLTFETRSDTCNGFFCGGLHGFFAGVAGKEPKALMAWPEESGGYAVAWVEPGKATPLGNVQLPAGESD